MSSHRFRDFFQPVNLLFYERPTCTNCLTQSFTYQMWRHLWTYRVRPYFYWDMLSFCLVSIIFRFSCKLGDGVGSKTPSSSPAGSTSNRSFAFPAGIPRFRSCQLAAAWWRSGFLAVPVVVGVVGADAAGLSSPMATDKRSRRFISLSMLSLAVLRPENNIKFRYKGSFILHKGPFK